MPPASTLCNVQSSPGVLCNVMILRHGMEWHGMLGRCKLELIKLSGPVTHYQLLKGLEERDDTDRDIGEGLDMLAISAVKSVRGLHLSTPPPHVEHFYITVSQGGLCIGFTTYRNVTLRKNTIKYFGHALYS